MESRVPDSKGRNLRGKSKTMQNSTVEAKLVAAAKAKQSLYLNTRLLFYRVFQTETRERSV